jgi:hypothetical protein
MGSHLTPTGEDDFYSTSVPVADEIGEDFKFQQ